MENENIINLIKKKIIMYEDYMEGADYDDFIRTEYAAGAMRQLLVEILKE